MTDSDRGMEGSDHRVSKLTRTVASGVLLAGVVAVVGCGGGGGNKSSTAPPPPAQSTSGSGGVVTAQGTVGLVGPAERANSNGSSFTTKPGNINAKEKPKQKKSGVVGEQCSDIDMMPSADNLAQVNAAVLCLVNAWRADSGLPALSSNSQLQQAAEGMAAEMVQKQFFSHETPEGKNVVDRVEPTGYIPNSSDWVVGENLAWGSGGLSTPQAIVNGWMNSPGHRANILAPDYKDVGLAAAMGAPSSSQSGGTTYVNDFGAKSGADSNVSLPPESGAATQAAAAGATVAGVKKATAKKKAKKKRKRKRRRRH
jgi:uncharacterized protein YkwD